MRRKRHLRKTLRPEQAKVLCAVCSNFFETPVQCLECSNWNVCMPCLRLESEEIQAVLRSRGITI